MMMNNLFFKATNANNIRRLKHTLRPLPRSYNSYYMKYCLGKNKYVNMNECDCIIKCKLIENEQITIHTSTTCSLTNTYKKLGDCNCEDRCSANDSELYLYDNDEYA
jgi:hypothetical protein|tara:strand:+ start:928 stop:1248 length:321 start_codon:yes stop_codon:yes gene_type:complete